MCVSIIVNLQTFYEERKKRNVHACKSGRYPYIFPYELLTSLVSGIFVLT